MIKRNVLGKYKYSSLLNFEYNLHYYTQLAHAMNTSTRILARWLHISRYDSF